MKTLAKSPNRTTPTWMIVLVLAFGFAANFLSPLNSGVQNAMPFCTELATMVSLAIWSYRRRASLIAISVICAVAMLLNLLFQFFAPGGSIVAGLLMGLAAGISIVVNGSILSLLPEKQTRSSIILGFALSSLIAGAILSIVPHQPAIVRCLPSAIYLLLLFLTLRLVPAHERSFAPASTTICKFGGLRNFYSVLFVQRNSMLFMLAIACVLSPMLGVFEGHAFQLGISLSTDTVVLFVAGVVALAVFAIGSVFHSHAWFETLFIGLMLVISFALLSILLAPAIAPSIYGVFGIATLVAMIPPCVFSIEFSHEQRISPAFVCAATLPAITSLGFEGGRIIDSVLYTCLGSSLYRADAAAALSLFVVAVTAVALCAAIAGVSHSESASSDEREPDCGSREGRLTSQLMDQAGLSQREAEVCVLYAHGRSAAHIAESSYLAESTVKTYIKRFYLKLGVHSRQELIDLLETYEKGE